MTRGFRLFFSVHRIARHLSFLFLGFLVVSRRMISAQEVIFKNSVDSRWNARYCLHLLPIKASLASCACAGFGHVSRSFSLHTWSLAHWRKIVTTSEVSAVDALQNQPLSSSPRVNGQFWVLQSQAKWFWLPYNRQFFPSGFTWRLETLSSLIVESRSKVLIGSDGAPSKCIQYLEAGRRNEYTCLMVYPGWHRWKLCRWL